MNRLDGKIALVTGGARGQGAAEAQLFADAGARVVITDRLDEVDTTAERLGDAVEALRHDVTQEDDWARVVETVVAGHGRIDVLVNNAGIFRSGGLRDTSTDTWNEVVAVNQTGVFLGMRAVAPVMMREGRGSIVNISSIAGLRGVAVAHAYAATKWAVRGMTRSAAAELAPHGIRVCSVHPGIIDTPMLGELGVVADAVTTRIPLGRIASAEEVAQLVLFLASDDSAYCTGHEFVVDGALTA